MIVPLLDLRRTPELDEALTAAFARVLASGNYIQGPEVDAFERAIATSIGVEHAIGVSSGTDALLAVLMALDVGPGDEVIVPTYTFFATAGVVARLGATPVFVDSRPDDFAIDPEGVRASLGPRTKAIVPVHLFGQCADMSAILEVAGDVPVIEDAAQAIGARYHGRAAGTLARAACFSFFPAKNLGAFGDAGLVTTDDADLAARVRRIRVHGAEPKYVHHEVGGNFRLDALQAALLGVKLPHLEAATEARRAHAAFYDHAFAASPSIATPPELADRYHAYNQYVVAVEERDDVKAALAGLGVASAVYYPRPLHLQPCFAGLGHRDGAFPVAERLSERLLALPVFPELTREELEHVAESLERCVDQRKRSGT
ncbi:MAG: DegT/DnrJ/EryC1/StrS family aminotransferase [Sandaracinaceae bacterium]|nr:DegT/DnrJ/EryC1/StrS family aminotransferase [Sandaracinaceae bacterium]